MRYPNPNHRGRIRSCSPDIRTTAASRLGRFLRNVIGLFALFGLLLKANPGACGEPSFTEYQVKALFLLNFTKYVDWPAGAFAKADSPITIGVLGENSLGDDLKKIVEGKIVSDRKIVTCHIQKEEDW